MLITVCKLEPSLYCSLTLKTTNISVISYLQFIHNAPHNIWLDILFKNVVFKNPKYSLSVEKDPVIKIQIYQKLFLFNLL